MINSKVERFGCSWSWCAGVCVLWEVICDSNGKEIVGGDVVGRGDVGMQQ